MKQETQKHSLYFFKIIGYMSACFAAIIIVPMLVITISMYIGVQDVVIENGFSEELRQQLFNEYQITIPENSVVLDGKYIETREGRVLCLYFKTPEESLVQLGEDWGMGGIAVIHEMELPEIDTSYKYGERDFPYETCLQQSKPFEGEVYYYLNAHNPSKKIK